MEYFKNKNIRVTPANQKIIKAVIRLHDTYEKYNDQRGRAEDDDNYKEVNRLNRICENQFDKVWKKIDELPKGLQKIMWKYVMHEFEL